MAEIDRDKLLDVYTRTMKVNRTDEKFRQLLMQGKVAVMYYCVRGQELVSAAAMAALEKDDYVVCTYRGQGEQTAKGIPKAFTRLPCDAVEFVGVEAERPVVFHTHQCAPSLLPVSTARAYAASETPRAGQPETTVSGRDRRGWNSKVAP